MNDRVKMIIVIGQRSDMNQSADPILFQFHEQAEGSHAGHLPLEFVANMLLHEKSLQAFNDVPLRL